MVAKITCATAKGRMIQKSTRRERGDCWKVARRVADTGALIGRAIVEGGARWPVPDDASLPFPSCHSCR